tara:strand:- start:483 stop:761 length:279 start_codon:yes stop_codon:yes gene_type:complete
MVMQIEKNVPIPSKYGANKKNSKHRHLIKIIESWEVGDSVAFKSVRRMHGKDKRAAYSTEAISLAQKARNAGQKTTQRVMADEGVIRVWRVE